MHGAMDYLRWHKLNSASARYDLTNSGVPAAQFADFDADPADVRLVAPGPYGDPALIEAIGARYRVNADGVVPVPGASSANFIAMTAVVDHGSCVMLEHPLYQPIVRVASFLGLTVLPLARPPSEGFGIRLAAVEEGLSRGARAIVLTNLHNPSGQCISAEMIEEVAGRCRRAKASLIVDEVYLDAANITRRTPLWSAANVADNVIGINSLTKVYGLSGLRMGWLLTNSDLAERARVVMDLLSTNNAAPSSALALRALVGIDRLEDRYRRLHREGQAVFLRWLAGEPSVSGYENQGGCFELIRLPAGVTADLVHDLLRRKYDTQVVPGTFFDLPDHVRLSTALSADHLAEALSRISAALNELR